MKEIKVMVVDDSVLMRKFISDILNEDPELEVIATASNGKFALDKIGQLNPDVVTLDVEMPEMDGIETLTRIMKENPLPVVMISALTQAGAELTFKALEIGAVDFITKPDMTTSRSILEIKDEIRMKVRTAARIKVGRITKAAIEAVQESVNKLQELQRDRSKKTSHPGRGAEKLVTIGISTGGPEALRHLLPLIPPEFPAGIMIVQHMPPGFTKAFADRMNAISQIEVVEAQDGDPIVPGRVLIAPGNYHMSVEDRSGSPAAKIDQKERVNLFRPSIDVLMFSTARRFRTKNIGIIMTGMARDGVEGIRRIKEDGGRTIAQDEETSVVFGMNKLAIQSGYVDKVVSLEKILPTILDWTERM